MPSAPPIRHLSASSPFSLPACFPSSRSLHAGDQGRASGAHPSQVRQALVRRHGVPAGLPPGRVMRGCGWNCQQGATQAADHLGRSLTTDRCAMQVLGQVDGPGGAGCESRMVASWVRCRWSVLLVPVLLPFLLLCSHSAICCQCLQIIDREEGRAATRKAGMMEGAREAPYPTGPVDDGRAPPL